MLTSYELREAVECRIGRIRSDAEYIRAEKESRDKLNKINAAEGREYGQDGYGDSYLVALTIENLRNARLRGFVNCCSDAFLDKERAMA